MRPDAMAGRGIVIALAALLVACCAPVALGAENGRIYYPVRIDEKTSLIYGANGDGTCAAQLTTGDHLTDLTASTVAGRKDKVRGCERVKRKR